MLVMILIVDSFDTSQAAVSNNGSPESTKERTKGLCFAKVEVNSSEFSRLFVRGCQVKLQRENAALAEQAQLQQRRADRLHEENDQLRRSSSSASRQS